MSTVLTGLSPEEIASELEIVPFQGKQIFRWLHLKRRFQFEAMTDLSKALRERLQADYVGSALQPELVQESSVTGTRKALFRMADGETVESVLIKDRDRLTVCISSQVGCALKCAFCATGLAGFRRHLTVSEIVEQPLHLLADENLDGRTPNIVYMGMGEPFRNYDAVMKSIHLLMHPLGLAWAPARLRFPPRAT